MASGIDPLGEALQCVTAGAGAPTREGAAGDIRKQEELQARLTRRYEQLRKAHSRLLLEVPPSPAPHLAGRSTWGGWGGWCCGRLAAAHPL